MTNSGVASIAQQVARIIAQYVVFLQLMDEENLNPDVAIKMLEALGPEVAALDKAFLCEMIKAFPLVAQEYSGVAGEVVAAIPHSFYLEEVLAADDPVRLAELDALRATVT
ncbi:hypothetical protein QP166_17620 [Sphingomonas sp. LR60]|uniref:hypothetical protein n=1 Tax=Sphingomonas sp. LR60 TaxID=3050233 RepID=UPI002FDF2BED